MKKMIKNLIKNLIGGVMLTGLIFGVFYLLGVIEHLVEIYPILWLPLIALAIYCIFKMVAESE